MRKSHPFTAKLREMGALEEFRALRDNMAQEGVPLERAERLAALKVIGRASGVNFSNIKIIPRIPKVPLPVLEFGNEDSLRQYFLMGFLACHARSEKPATYDRRTGEHMRWIARLLLGEETPHTAPTEGLRLLAELLDKRESMHDAVRALFTALVFTQKPVHMSEEVLNANSRRTKEKAS